MDDDYAINQDLTGLTIKDKNIVSPKYLFFAVRSLGKHIKNSAQGLGVTGVTRSFVKDLSIPLPPLAVQREIVGELEGYQKIIDGCRQVVDNYKPPITIDPSWERVRFEEAPFEIIDGDRGENYPSGSDFSGEGYCLFLNTKNVRKDGFDFSEKTFVTKEKDDQLRKGKLKVHDVILTTRGTIGNTAYYSNDVSFEHIRINSGMLIFRVNSNELIPRYLFYFFQSKNCSDQFRKLMSGSAQPQLPISSLRNALIPLPPIDVQREIVGELEGYQKIVDGNKHLIKVYSQKIHDKISQVWDA